MMPNKIRPLVSCALAVTLQGLLSKVLYAKRELGGVLTEAMHD